MAVSRASIVQGFKNLVHENSLGLTKGMQQWEYHGRGNRLGNPECIKHTPLVNQEDTIRPNTYKTQTMRGIEGMVFTFITPIALSIALVKSPYYAVRYMTSEETKKKLSAFWQRMHTKWILGKSKSTYWLSAKRFFVVKVGDSASLFLLRKVGGAIPLTFAYLIDWLIIIPYLNIAQGTRQLKNRWRPVPPIPAPDTPLAPQIDALGKMDITALDKTFKSLSLEGLLALVTSPSFSRLHNNAPTLHTSLLVAMSHRVDQNLPIVSDTSKLNALGEKELRSLDLLFGWFATNYPKTNPTESSSWHYRNRTHQERAERAVDAQCKVKVARLAKTTLIAKDSLALFLELMSMRQASYVEQALMNIGKINPIKGLQQLEQLLHQVRYSLYTKAENAEHLHYLEDALVMQRARLEDTSTLRLNFTQKQALDDLPKGRFQSVLQKIGHWTLQFIPKNIGVVGLDLDGNQTANSKDMWPKCADKLIDEWQKNGGPEATFNANKNTLTVEGDGASRDAFLKYIRWQEEDSDDGRLRFNIQNGA